ncbi:PQQ-binding-like beta-propeller repeat protein [Marinactinospora thermotolerans]|uniref:Pyrrolo-quinoline quinone repeat domain-containing protein n=1 Tax=Marinactinospora thermotolerans DSM 45154 TaxID=1122192 RepID=A0A1T4SCA9_9ACTN|nr:PQQ-binding-like beta-propeller repeat protein [Marinactinospora thermotolerans]SKA25511.1 hypothetical protein SAMN02745673_03314 [Marinactinospora thermotolerans DSM 45154]
MSPEHRRPLATALSLAALLAVGGCSTPAEDAPSPKPSESGAAQPPAEPIVPATRFDTDASVTLQRDFLGEGAERLPVALRGGVAYYTSGDRLIAHDTIRDESLWTLSTEETFDAENPGHSAVLVETDDGPVVFGAFRTHTTASGTTRASSKVEVIAADADSGDLLWHAVHDHEEYEEYTPRVVGVSGDSVILNAGTTLALDLAGGEVTWSDESEPRLVMGSTVIGTVSHFDRSTWMRAVDAATGEELWTAWEDYAEDLASDQRLDLLAEFQEGGAEPGEVADAAAEYYGYFVHSQRQGAPVREEFFPAGPGRFAVVAFNYLNTNLHMQVAGGKEPTQVFGTVLLVSAETGRIEYSFAFDPEIRERMDNDWGGWVDGRCRHDGERTLACWGWAPQIRSTVVFALDTEEGALRWVEEFGGEAERADIDPTGAWRGALYGEAGGGAVVLDLDDGADLETLAEMAPATTNGVVAVEYGENGEFTVAPVTG